MSKDLSFFSPPDALRRYVSASHALETTRGQLAQLEQTDKVHRN